MHKQPGLVTKKQSRRANGYYKRDETHDSKNIFQTAYMKSQKRKVLLRFVLLYVVSVLLMITLFSAIKSAPAKEKKDTSAELLVATARLNDHLIELNGLNEHYLKQFRFPITNNSRDSVLKIQQAIKDKIDIKIDSITRLGRNLDTDLRNGYDTMLSKFYSSYHNWQNMNNLILSMKGSDSSITKIPIKEVSAKDERTARLEDRLNALQSKVRTLSASKEKDDQEIHFLKWAVRSQVATIKTLESKLKAQ